MPLNEKIHHFLFSKGIVRQRKDGTLYPVHRYTLESLTDLEIVTVYNAELRGICNYYSMASNFRKLDYFAYLSEDCIKNTAVIFANSRNSFENRLKAKCCELCGSTESDCYEIHHVHRIKDLKGKAWWEIAMIAKRRKTLVVCRECHYKIHNRVPNDQATMESRIP